MFLSDGPHSEASEKLDHAAKDTKIQIKQVGYFYGASSAIPLDLWGLNIKKKNAIIMKMDPTSIKMFT